MGLGTVLQQPVVGTQDWGSFAHVAAIAVPNAAAAAAAGAAAITTPAEAAAETGRAGRETARVEEQILGHQQFGIIVDFLEQERHRPVPLVAGMDQQEAVGFSLRIA